MTRDMGQNMLLAVKTEDFSSKNGGLFVADFSDSYLAVSACKNDAKSRKPNSFITPMTRDMGQNILPAVKTENVFSHFSDFYLVVIPSKNDAKIRKPISYITTTTCSRDMGQNMLPTVKNGKLFVADFSDFYLAILNCTGKQVAQRATIAHLRAIKISNQTN